MSIGAGAYFQALSSIPQVTVPSFIPEPDTFNYSDSMI